MNNETTNTPVDVLAVVENGEQLDITLSQLPAIASMVYEFAPGQYHIADGFSWDDIESALARAVGGAK